MPQSSLNKQQSQQIRDINRSTRRLEARHKNQRTSGGRREALQKCFIVPKWHFFYCCGELKPIRSLRRQMQLLGELASVSQRVLPPVYCFSHQSCQFWSDKFENIVFIVLLRRWKKDWNVWQHELRNCLMQEIIQELPIILTPQQQRPNRMSIIRMIQSQMVTLCRGATWNLPKSLCTVFWVDIYLA